MDDEQCWSEETVTNALQSRNPSAEDLLELNSHGAKYLIVGGSIRRAGYARDTGDIDIVIDAEPDNEARVFKSLEFLPDKAVLELEPGEVGKYTAVRVAEEIVVDLRHSASRIDYEEVFKDIVIRHVQGGADSVCFTTPALADEEHASRKGCGGFALSADLVSRGHGGLIIRCLTKSENH